jgi:hypothetical protein
MTTANTTRLRIAPRAADLTLVADPALDRLFAATSMGAKPTINEEEGAVDVRYSIRGRLQALSRRHTSLTLRLSAATVWAIELDGGVSGLRADLGGLRVASVAIGGGASDIELELPSGGLEVRIDGGVSKATIRRPAGVPVELAIDGGSSDVRLDEQAVGAVGGELRLVTPGEGDPLAVRIAGGASRLTIA